jgi:folate-binding protein YgfZ
MSDQPTVGYFKAPEPGVLILRGDDAGEFLNGQVTNDVGSLADGESKYALLLTPKGKMRAEMVVVRDGDETMVVCPAEHLSTIRQTIDTFRIGFFFSTEDATGQWSLVKVIGDADALPPIAVPVVELESPLGMDLLVESDDLDAVIGSLDLPELSETDLERARIKAGVPAFGTELNEDTFPAEAALVERAVSFTKGCYVGQETVARMHYKGRPNRHLRLLCSEDELSSGAPVTNGVGKLLGEVGTVARDTNGEWWALAILRRESEPGDLVTTNGATAVVVEIHAPATS